MKYIVKASIAQSLEDGHVAIYDIMDDPRIQYPKEAQKEGISSILSVPIVVAGNLLGAVRVYTSGSLHWMMSILFRRWPKLPGGQ